MAIEYHATIHTLILSKMTIVSLFSSNYGYRDVMCIGLFVWKHNASFGYINGSTMLM